MREDVVIMAGRKEMFWLSAYCRGGWHGIDDKLPNLKILKKQFFAVTDF